MTAPCDGRRQGGGFAVTESADRPDRVKSVAFKAGKERIEIFRPTFLIARIAAEHEKQVRLPHSAKVSPSKQLREFVEIGLVIEDVLHADALLGCPGEEGG